MTIRDAHPHELSADRFIVSDDPARLDFDVIHAFLSTCYWSPGIPRDLVERAAANSLCFGVYRLAADPAAARPQVGYARMITDKATFAYLADVFIIEAFRGRGLSKLLMRAVVSHPDLRGLRRMMLLTRDAHGLYSQFGFTPMARPDRAMEKHVPDAYAPRP